ncbi:LLM class flavin-dependent oxidoreductase [Actinocatenispora comari]|jgi:alkanesulfonate monooxygenase SsuD/methylene tetrahydromethanopterin reductase-like flavin-dependent oxidoreductase (luciferase family)|nr:LLM class flavin-dependent oxidoreductase [Actinocatenispora comari]
MDVFLVAGAIAGQSPEQAVRRALDHGVAAERAGFDGAWIAEHHFIRYGGCPSAIAFAGHLLGRTARITVGTAACVLSTRHPVALAEEAILLDTLSDGRFRLGVARGGPWVDLEVFGSSLERLEHGFPESLDLLTRWLSGAERIAGTGPLFGFREVTVVPRAHRPVPVLVAATSSATVAVAAARGLPLLLGLHATDAEKVTMLDRYAEIAAAHGHAPETIPHASAHLAQVAGSRREAAALLRSTMPAWLATTGDYVRIDGRPPSHRDQAAYLDMLLSSHPIGSPAECADRLAATVAATGVHRVLLLAEAAGDPHRVRDNIDRLACEVAPAALDR